MTAVRVVAFVLVALVLGAGHDRAVAQDDGPPRLALVIGEAAYPQKRLATADADAGLMATAFAQAGFDVTALADADVALLRRTIVDFSAKARAAGPGAVLAIYLAGYGLQYAGENWLVPVGAQIDGDADVPKTAMKLSEFARPLEAVPAAMRLFLFDVARAPPFAWKGPQLAGGLALADAPVGSLYGYNTAPGAIAPADVPPYGSYARALAEAMQAPGLPIGEVLRRVRLRVGERTDGAAVPFDDGSAEPGFAFFPGAPFPATVLPALAGLTPAAAYATAVARDTLPGYLDFIAAFSRDPLAGRVRAMAAARREALTWSEAVRADTPRAFWTYMRRYPRGPHLDDVRRKLFDRHAALEPPPRFDIVPFEGVPSPPPEEVALLERLTFAAVEGPPIPPPPATLLPTPRSAFFDTLPSPPLTLEGSLPLPLPVPTSDHSGRSPGRIEEPGVPQGALVAALTADRDGVSLTIAAADGTRLSRLSEIVEHGTRTLNQIAADGASISKVTLAPGADGTLTLTQVGPAERPLSRAVGREATAGGGRTITLFDAVGQPVAVTLVSPTEIVTLNAMISGRTLPHFVLLPGRDTKGGPAIALEGEMALRSALPAGPEMPKAGAGAPAQTDAGHKDTGKAEPRTDEKTATDNASASSPVAQVPSDSGAANPGSANPGAGISSAASSSAAKPPALPAAAGLTGKAPVLDIPPPPPTPAFDAAAPPLVPPPASPMNPAVPAVKPIEPVVPLQAPSAILPQVPSAPLQAPAAVPSQAPPVVPQAPPAVPQAPPVVPSQAPAAVSPETLAKPVEASKPGSVLSPVKPAAPSPAAAATRAPPDATRLPSEPPLPPQRSQGLAPKAKHSQR